MIIFVIAALTMSAIVTPILLALILWRMGQLNYKVHAAFMSLDDEGGPDDDPDDGEPEPEAHQTIRLVGIAA